MLSRCLSQLADTAVVGFLSETTVGNRYPLVLVEYFTKWFKALEFPSVSAVNITDH